MASTLVASAALATDRLFIATVTAGVQRHATTIGPEILAKLNPETHDKLRLTLAQQALADSPSIASRFVAALATDPAVESGVDEATIMTKIAALWDLVAGVTI